MTARRQNHIGAFCLKRHAKLSRFSAQHIYVKTVRKYLSSEWLSSIYITSLGLISVGLTAYNKVNVSCFKVNILRVWNVTLNTQLSLGVHRTLWTGVEVSMVKKTLPLPHLWTLRRKKEFHQAKWSRSWRLIKICKNFKVDLHQFRNCHCTCLYLV